MAITNREISQNGLIMSLQEENHGLKGNVSFWKERAACKMIHIEEMEVRIVELETQNNELRIFIAGHGC